MLPKQRVDRRSITGIWNVINTYIRSPLKHFEANVLGGCGADAGEREIARFCARCAQKIGERVIG